MSAYSVRVSLILNPILFPEREIRKERKEISEIKWNKLPRNWRSKSDQNKFQKLKIKIKKLLRNKNEKMSSRCAELAELVASD